MDVQPAARPRLVPRAQVLGLEAWSGIRRWHSAQNEFLRWGFLNHGGNGRVGGVVQGWHEGHDRWPSHGLPRLLLGQRDRDQRGHPERRRLAECRLGGSSTGGTSCCAQDVVPDEPNSLPQGASFAGEDPPQSRRAGRRCGHLQGRQCRHRSRRDRSAANACGDGCHGCHDGRGRAGCGVAATPIWHHGRARTADDGRLPACASVQGHHRTAAGAPALAHPEEAS
mmetsp:Transcript_148927/g.414968  ORF Transcript_148927/g.414968 Transcript_148927/m.414968 type:complete len:225 (-) Transcript_148927:1437-2111(-)